MDFLNCQIEHSQGSGGVAHFSLSQQFLLKVLICTSVTLSWQMTSGGGGLQLWKCLYLARNVTKGNNVLSQSTLMDLATISPVPPLTRETTANKAVLPLMAWVLLTAVQHCWWPAPPSLPPETHTLTSDLDIKSHGLSASQISLINCVTARFGTKELHWKFTFYTDTTAAELYVSSGHVGTSVMWAEPSFTVIPLVVATTWPHIDHIGYWSGMIMS